MLAMLYHIDNKLTEAEKAYEATLAVDGHAAVAANNLAWLYLESNRNLDQALQLAQTAKAALPDEPNVNDTLGWAYYKKALYPQALEALQHSVEKDPTNVSAQYHLGLTSVRLSRHGWRPQGAEGSAAAESEVRGRWRSAQKDIVADRWLGSRSGQCCSTSTARSTRSRR